jgi:OmpA-OmpF porin, OOP family
LDLKEGFWKMGTLRNSSILACVTLLFAMGGSSFLAGCTAEAKAAGSFEAGSPPPPAPAPPDDDGDGILNADDQCPTEKEDGKPPNDKDGCPVKDSDGDGITDDVDKCPDQPETKNDFEDEDGCPDKKPLVQLVGQEVRINQKIQFKKGSAGIEDESKPVLDAVAEVLSKNNDIQLVEVGGHASKEGDAGFNKTLTQKRVESVVKELVIRKVAKERLLAQGFGFYCPLDAGDSPEALEKNRRVEFKILIRAGKPTDMKRGCEAAEKANIKPKALPAKPWTAPAEKPAAAAKTDAKAAPAAAATKAAATKSLGAPKK